MMWKEFEEIAGYEVSLEDYTKIIEPMYMATNMTKQDFVKCIDRKRFALKTKTQLVSEMRKITAQIIELLGHTTHYEEDDALRKIEEEYAERFGFDDFYHLDGYECPSVQRGCTFHYEVVFYCKHGRREERIVLDKNYKKLFAA